MSDHEKEWLEDEARKPLCKSAQGQIKNILGAATRRVDPSGPGPSDFATYCQAFDAQALRVAKYQYKKLTTEQLEMIIALRTAPFIATALSDFQRQPCNETESMLIHEIIQAYWERVSK
jgi:hypothetical protein